MGSDVNLDSEGRKWIVVKAVLCSVISRIWFFHPCGSIYQYFILFNGQIVFHMNIPHFVYPFHSAFFTVQLSHPYMTTGKTIALTRWTFVGKVMSLLLNMLSRLVITFLPRSRHLLISWLQSPSAVILEPKKIKSATVSIVSPIYFPWSDGTGCHDFSFLNVEL